MNNTNHWIFYQSWLHTCWNLTMSALIINLNLVFCFDSNEELKVLTTSVFQTGNLPHSYRLISVVSHIGSTSSSGKWTSWFQHFYKWSSQHLLLIWLLCALALWDVSWMHQEKLWTLLSKSFSSVVYYSLKFLYMFFKMVFSNILGGWGGCFLLRLPVPEQNSVMFF